MEKIDNYSGYTKVLRNFIEIIRNYVISYKVIRHKLEPGRSILEENK